MFVVFNADTTCYYGFRERYSDAERLRKSLQRKAEKLGWKRDYQVYHRDFYNWYVVHERTVRNFMTGKPVVERSNIPYSCSVASETYWSS